MFRSKRFILLAALAVMVLIAGGIAAAQSSDQVFPAPLFPGKGVPYSPSGEATFMLSSDGKALDFTLDVSDVHDLTNAVIEVTPSNGMEGETVAWLFPFPYPGYVNPVGDTVLTLSEQVDSSAFTFSGKLSSGTITASDLRGPLAGKSISDLVQMIKDGKAYVSVQSADYSQDALSGTIK
jgi:hypothetical protein